MNEPYKSKLGPIPPEHFENDPPFRPDVDISRHAELLKKIIEIKKQTQEQKK